MFDLEKRERFIILFLIVTLLIGIAAIYYKKSDSAIDVKIRSFAVSGSGTAADKININDADEALLIRLPGVGNSLARKIIEYRRLHGAFSSIDELKQVSGIKSSLFEKIKDKVSVE